MAALLSHKIVVGPMSAILMLDSRIRNHTHALAGSKPVIYSTSHDEAATVVYLCAIHEMMPDPSENPYLPTLRLVSRQFAQSESVKPNSFVVQPPSFNCRLCVPFR